MGDETALSLLDLEKPKRARSLAIRTSPRTHDMQQSGIKRFFSQSAVKTPGSAGGNSAGQGSDATPSQKPVKRPRAAETDTDENNSNCNIRQTAQVRSALVN